MKSLLVYSSKTSNTKKIAEVINKKLKPSYFNEVDKTPISLIEKHDLIIVGGWIDKGTMNKEVVDFVSKIKNKKIAFFFTLGAYPNSMHAYDCINKIRELFLKNNNHVIGHFHVQGAIDQKLIEWMKNLPVEHDHAVDEDRINRWHDAKNHPSDEDFNASKSFVSMILKKMEENNEN